MNEAMGSRPRAARTPSAERRRQLLEHAVGEFARRGLRGASTQAIAARCGLSQPYLFRLFDSKGALFLAVLEYGFDLLEAGAGATRRPDAGIAPARLRLMQRHNGELAQLFLQGCAAACDDDQVADLLRRRLRRLAAQCGRSGVDLVTEILRTAGTLALREDRGYPRRPSHLGPQHASYRTVGPRAAGLTHYR